MAEVPEQVREKLIGRLEELARRHRELEQALSDPEVVKEQVRYAELAKEHGALSRFAEMQGEFERARERRREAEELLKEAAEEPDMQGLAREEIAEAERTEQKVLERALDLLLSDAGEEDRNVIVEIRSGTGGEEAALFAADLFGMYARYAEKQGWQVEILDRSLTDRGGFKQVTFSVSGAGASKKLRYESGGHRVQRIPVTESQGRIHTSLATVAVLPEAREVDVAIRPEDLDITFMRSQGPGGQNVNKVSSCVRIVHKPTGIAVKCQEESSQHKNRKLALKMLRAMLYRQQEQEQKDRRDELRRSQVGSGDRNERIRTYNFPQDRITDHRIGLDVFGIENVLMGDCDRLFDALAQWDKQQRIKALAEK